ncbi:MAG: SpoIID/LytB domain-containing protein [Ruminococcaceae bacterium]|nr:SpoIID/LytB domain-containing protein [Oscillospiraceae bacterium]
MTLIRSNASRLIAIILILAALCALIPPVSAAPALTDYSNYIVRSGLYYGSSSLSAANFQIVSGTGTGFTAGYYGSDRSFVPLYTLSGETEITVTRANHYNISSGGYVSDGTDNSNVVGAYHVELEISFEDQSELTAAVSQVYAATNYFAFPAYTSSGYRVRIGRYTDKSAAEEVIPTLLERIAPLYPDATMKVVGKGTNAYMVLRTGTKNILYEFDGASRQLGIQPIGSKAETWHKGYRYYGGFDFDNTSSTSLAVISVVKLGDYVKGVTPYELNTSWPEESLKAHALCAQTFAVMNRNRSGHAAYGFDVCTGQHCQVYRGTTGLTTKIANCVDAVAGMIITYNGEPINAVYHSSNGGWSENSENVWVATVPYLRAVEDPFETLSYANNGLWSTSITAAKLTNRLNAYGYAIGRVTGVSIAELTEVGNVLSINVTDGTKTVKLSKENMRMVVGTSVLLSQNFRIVNEGEVYVNDDKTTINGLLGMSVINGDGSTTTLSSADATVLTGSGTEILSATPASGDEFFFEGKGWGHSLGLSQLGSRGMANAGWTYDQIIKYYFTGVQIAGLDY